MIELITSYTLTQVPYVTYEALDEYAEAVVRDFAPERLRIPGPLDTEALIKDYLGLSVEFHKLNYGKKVLGMTAFEDGYVQTLDKATGEIVTVPVKAGTVVIDISLKEKRNMARLRFTYGHESSHNLIHRKAFMLDNLFRTVGEFDGQRIAAKRGRIDYSRSRNEKTDHDWVERQADFLSSALLMPLPALRKAYIDFFAASGEKTRRVVRGSSPKDDELAARMPEYMAKVFAVSKRAALIRMEKLKAICDKKVMAYPFAGGIYDL
jgi:Zn-dependent peptidase ImmA (M78 family)